jgi:hypothetical protein
MLAPFDIVSDVKEQLQEMHYHNLVYGDVRCENIVRMPSGQHRLIDYGRTFSVRDPKFPPMEYMTESGEIPEQADDFIDLGRLLGRLLGGKY